MVKKIPAFDSFGAIESGRITCGLSIALLRLKRLVGLEIVKARNQDWTDEGKEKLMREHMEGDLFSEAEAKRQVTDLRKVSFGFYYRHVCDTPRARRSTDTRSLIGRLERCFEAAAKATASIEKHRSATNWRKRLAEDT